MTRRIAFVTLMILGVLALVESAGAIVYYLRYSSEQRRLVETTLGIATAEHNPVTRYRPHPYLNYAGNPEFSLADGRKLNGPLGFRRTDVALFEKSPEAFRVVALGGSTTYGMYFENGESTWPDLVGVGLRIALDREIEVVNAGVPNYGTFELLGLAAMWLPELVPDVVVLHTGLNDAFAVGFPDEGGPDNTEFRFSWSHRPMPSAARVAMRRSYLLRALGMGWIARSGFQVGDMANAMQRPVPPPEQLRQNVSQATGKYFRRNLITLVTLIRLTGAEPVLVDMPLNPSVASASGEYFSAVSDAVMRNNRIIAEVGAANDVTVVRIHDRVVDPEMFMDAAHMSQAGMFLKGKLIAEALVPVVERVREQRSMAQP